MYRKEVKGVKIQWTKAKEKINVSKSCEMLLEKKKKTKPKKREQGCQNFDFRSLEWSPPEAWNKIQKMMKPVICVVRFFQEKKITGDWRVKLYPQMSSIRIFSRKPRLACFLQNKDKQSKKERDGVFRGKKSPKTPFYCQFQTNQLDNWISRLPNPNFPKALIPSLSLFVSLYLSFFSRMNLFSN